jgi:hypothetical protein
MRLKAAVGWALMIGLLAIGAAEASSAVGGSYSGTTVQGNAVTFTRSGGAVRNFKIVILDKCPDGHVLRVTARYPPMKINAGHFGGSFTPVNGHAGERAKLTGQTGTHKVTGTLNDTSYSQREGALCHGKTGFTAKRG